MHLGPAGHQHMAIAVLDALGVPHELEELPPTPHPELTGRELRAQNVQWARDARRPVGAPPPHRSVLRRRHLAEAAHAGPDRTGLPGRVTSPPSAGLAPRRRADVAQLVERDLPKVDVASSNLVIRSMAFEGFPDAALDFYDDLELDNTKSFWQAHKHVYDSAVRDPMLALTASLAEEFGTAKVFRPYRDVRFAKDKTPYKTAQGAFVSVGPATGWYVEIGSPGVRVGGGYYHAGGPDLARIRTRHRHRALRRGARSGSSRRLEKRGFEIRGEQLKTTPRGYPPTTRGSTCCATSRWPSGSPTASRT